MKTRPAAGARMNVLPAGIIAATAGGMVWAIASCWYNDQLDLRSFVATSLLSAIVGMAIGALAAPALARWTIRDAALGWANAALTGALAPTVPGLIFLLATVPVRAWMGEELTIRGWIAGIPMLALAGAAAGIVFRSLYGSRSVTQ